ncbi:hypothetical protein N7490_010516 [Penicillium lividum]|nr:hypothetical protein N7490_010516 [Penicillium lividum]
MHSPLSLISVFSIYSRVVFADYLGPTYPPPVDLSSQQSLVAAAWQNLTVTIDAYLKQNHNDYMTTSLSGIQNTTFSTNLFSIHDSNSATLQYHWTSPEIASSKNGTNKVNGDSIYRMASASKLFTTYAGMVTLTEEEWNRPLTQINPLFAKATAKANENPIWHVEWDNITPWALASQISGIPRQGWPALDSLFNFTIYDYLGLPTENPVTAWGLPPTDISTLGPCWNISGTCDGPDLIEAVRNQPPAFLPWQTPIYANDNFIMLGLMMSNITGRSMADIYQKELFEPLNLTSSFSSPPTSRADLARAVVAGAPEISGFFTDIPVSTPSGGLFTSSNDFAKFGISILNSTLLPYNTTRKWMKPHSHSASLTYSLGAPWEIIRYLNPSTGKVTDLYTKLGDSGFYGSIIVLIPDYDAGFSILAASTGAERSAVTNAILDSIADTVLPALEAQAAFEATRNYVGTYESTDSVNSTITVAFNESSVITSKSGLSITRWISNGTDVLASDRFQGGRPRLLLSIPKQTVDGEEGQVAFQVTPQPQLWSYFAPGAKRLQTTGPFSGQYNTNYDWLVADAAHYAGLGMNLFVFGVNEHGNATSLRPAAQRVTLQRR